MGHGHDGGPDLRLQRAGAAARTRSCASRPAPPTCPTAGPTSSSPPPTRTARRSSPAGPTSRTTPEPEQVRLRRLPQRDPGLGRTAELGLRRRTLRGDPQAGRLGHEIRRGSRHRRNRPEQRPRPRIRRRCYDGGDHEEELRMRRPKCRARCRRTNRSSHILVWDRKQNSGMAGGPKDGTNAPKVYDNEGHSVDQLPTNVEEVPGGRQDARRRRLDRLLEDRPATTRTTPSRRSKPSSRPADWSNPPGSVYDNDLQTGTVTVVSKTGRRRRHPARPDLGNRRRLPAGTGDLR